MAVGTVVIPALLSPVHADTVVVGAVEDATTTSRVAGASVVLRRGMDVLGTAASDREGRFRMSIPIPVRPEAQALKLLVERDGYVDASDDVVVVSGRTDRPTYLFSLLPKAVADCRRTRAHAVIVGYFRPPTTAPQDLDLAPRVADALAADLLTRMQQLRLKNESLPSVLSCGGARPRASTDHGQFARALNGDAFVSGYVVPAGAKYKVEMVIADRFDVQAPPARVSSKDVDLDDPQVARLDTAAHAAILSALVRGYEQAGKHAECVEVTVAAERIVGRLPASVGEVRARCQARLGNRGLLPGGSR